MPMLSRLLFLCLFVAGVLLPASASTVPSGPFVMGPPVVSVATRAAFLHAMNPAVDLATALNYALLYEEEGAYEGVNPDLAFAQMLLETSYLRFGGQVKTGQNNFAGLGAVDGGDRGLVFSSPRQGIRAQIQHLKYYASTEPLNGAPVNPRLGFVKRASAPTVGQLARSWASDPDYGIKLTALLARMGAHADRTAPRPPRGSAPAVAPAGVPGN